MTLTNEKVLCKNCGGNNFETDSSGFTNCIECGVVQENTIIDEGPEWRNFSKDGVDNSNERVGMPSTNLLHDKGLTTDIGWQNKDFAGVSMSSDMSKLFRRLRRQHQRTRVNSSTERNLAVALGELQRLSAKMTLPTTVREEAAYIYRKAVEQKLVRGRSIEGVVASSIYAACRIHGIPRTLDEVGKHSRTGRKEIGRTFRAISKELMLKVPPADPDNYVPRFCAKLNLPINVVHKANEILKRATEIELTAGRGPTGIAAASVYLASILEKEQRTQKQVSEAAGVTEVTIRNRYKEICEALKIDVNG
tara:strand:- start:14616 stop:15536 length:921 start_codon:yes stop_codon:yes gene_type:complete